MVVVFLVALLLSILFTLSILLTILYLKSKLSKPNNANTTPIRIAFLHPHCFMGGGGERVLWTSILALLHHNPTIQILIYTSSTTQPPTKTLQKILPQQMKLTIPPPYLPRLTFIPLHSYHFTNPTLYPRFTLLFQSLAALPLAYEALFKSSPSPFIFIDTSNHPFTIPLAKFLGISTISYIHYPVISNDMLSSVASQKSQFNNNTLISNSKILSQLKLIYYKMFAGLYGIVGGFNDVVMVNSSWTYHHVSTIFGGRNRDWIRVVFPPCELEELVSIGDRKRDGDGKGRREKGLIVSVGQFRPEKNHTLQLYALKELLSKNKDISLIRNVRLVVIGGTRNAEDCRRAEDLKKLAVDLGVDRNCEIVVNAPRSTVLDYLGKASIGIHTMRDEHFGISVVELMAAGLITVAHNSGGVCCDIIQHGVNGFLAESREDYVERLKYVLGGMNEEVAEGIRRNARESIGRFASERFSKEFVEVVGSAIDRINSHS